MSLFEPRYRDFEESDFIPNLLTLMRLVRPIAIIANPAVMAIL